MGVRAGTSSSAFCFGARPELVGIGAALPCEPVFRPAGASQFAGFSHGLRHGLHSFAALRLQPQCRLREAHAAHLPGSDCQRSDIIRWIIPYSIAYLIGKVWSSPKTSGTGVAPDLTLVAPHTGWRSGDEWACFLASHPSAKSAEGWGTLLLCVI